MPSYSNDNKESLTEIDRIARKSGGPYSDMSAADRIFTETMSGKRRWDDIELPNTTGKVDPRIKRKTPDPIAGLKKAGQHLQMLREKGLFKRKAE